MVSTLSQMSLFMRRQLGLAYDLHAETLRLDRIAGHLAAEPTPVNEEYHPASIDGTIPEISFLVGCERAGLLLFEGRRIRRLFSGRDFYGITRRAGRWWVSQRYAGGNGRVISFRIEDGRAVDARTEITGLLRGIHQIDFIDESLWIVDSYHDRVLVVPVDAIDGHWRGHCSMHYPIGRSRIGREQPNHAHMNSVLGWNGVVYLVAHNETVKTGRESELLELEPGGTVRDRIPMGGSCCHNIGFLDGDRVFCRSLEGTVNLDGVDVLRLDGFVRGLALGDDYEVVGTSQVQGDRAARARGSGRVVITDRGFRPLGTVVLPRTQVFEVRRVDVPDLGLSATQGRSAARAA